MPLVACSRDPDRLCLALGLAPRCRCTYAVYGGIYVVVALLWLWRVDGVPATRWDLVGRIVCPAAMAIIALQPPTSVGGSERPMKIGELAAAAQTQAETIRFYEREGLLPPAPRSEGNYRIYGSDHAERLGFIRHCRSLDMTLDEIRVLLRFKDSPQKDCGDVNALIDAPIGHVAARVRELKQLEKHLRALRDQCTAAREAGQCGILTELAQGAVAPRPTTARQPGHVGGAHTRHRNAGDA